MAGGLCAAATNLAAPSGSQPAPPSLSHAARRLWTIPAGWDLLASDRPVASRTRHLVNTSLGYHLAAVSINSLGLNNTHGPRPMGTLTTTVTHSPSSADTLSRPEKKRWRVRLAQGPGSPRCNPIRTSRLSKRQGPSNPRRQARDAARREWCNNPTLPHAQSIRRKPAPVQLCGYRPCRVFIEVR